MASKETKKVTALGEGGELVEVEIPAWLAVLEMREDDADVKEAIVQQILAAETLEDLLSGLPDTTAPRDILDQVITVFEPSLRPSAMKDSLGAFAIIPAKSAKTGEDLVITCGGANVLAQLVRAKQLGLYPFDTKFYEVASKSNPGQTVLWLRMPEAF